MLKTLRDRGLKAVIFEAGNDTGGTWRWNVSTPRRHVYALPTQVFFFFMLIPIPLSHDLHFLFSTTNQTA